MPFVSVIIPVYNVEKYLPQCIESVLSQSLNDMEIILVDDGSPDRCPQICDHYAEKYEYIQVIHKENGGLSSARNTGIMVARGEYLIFMDSDDYWNSEVKVKRIFDIVKQSADVEMFLFTSYDLVEGVGLFKRKEHENLKSIRTDTVEHYYQDLLNNGNLEVSACTKILKKDFLVKNKLYFCENLLSEDNQWMLRVLRTLTSVAIIDEPLYICRTDRQDSITHTIKRKNIEDLLKIVDESIDFHKNTSDFEKWKIMEWCYASYLWFSALGLSFQLSSNDRKAVKHLFKKTKIVCNYSNSKKTKACNIILKIAGIDITMFVLGTYIRMKEKSHMNKKRKFPDGGK